MEFIMVYGSFSPVLVDSVTAKIPTLHWWQRFTSRANLRYWCIVLQAFIQTFVTAQETTVSEFKMNKEKNISLF